MNREEIKSAVREVMYAVLSVPIAADVELTRTSEPEWDSLRHIELVLCVEDRFDVHFPEETIPRLNSVTAIADAVLEQRETANQY